MAAKSRELGRRRLVLAFRFLAILCCAGLLSACLRTKDSAAEQADAAEKPPEWFVDITDSSGLSFRHEAGKFGQYHMPEMTGSGAAMFDFNNDGRLDVYLAQNGGPNSSATNRLFRQTSDGKFIDVTAGSGLDIRGFGMGVAVGDVNNDGFADVLVTEYGRARLFLNKGNGTFTDITKDSGLDNPFWGTSACFVDYDRDGWLDLVIVNYIDYTKGRPCSDAAGNLDYCGPNNFSGCVTKLYRNLGTGGTTSAPTLAAHQPTVPRLRDVTIKSGLATMPGPGLGVVCADFNGDRWPDVFVANDGQANRLWINRKDGTFSEEAVFRGVAFNQQGMAEANMGVAVGDMNGDGLLDVYVTHLTEETNTLWLQGPRGMFQDRTARWGLANLKWRGTGFGTVPADFNHDGTLDLAVANGRVKRPPLATRAAAPAHTHEYYWDTYAERAQLFSNDGKGRFRDISADNTAFCGTPQWARGLACGDMDNDGALDLLLTTVGGGARLYRNVAPNRGHWLMVRALDPALRRDAYGAEIRVSAGSRRWLRVVNPGYSYLCSNDPRAHFGLDEVSHVDAIDVIWPDGEEERFPGGQVDRLVLLEKGKGMSRPTRSAK